MLQSPRLRLGLLLWVSGMPGVIAVTFTLLPKMLEREALPLRLGVVLPLSLLQSAIVIALAVWAGVAWAPQVGLDAPVFRAASERRSLGEAIRPQIVPGVGVGLVGGGLLYTAWRFAPAALAQAQERLSLPLIERVLYGGISEELLLRWGFMTALLWLAWSFLQRRRGVPSPGYVWLAIAVSALLFALGHLPAAAVLAGPLRAGAVMWVISANTAFGLMFGYLYWRRGLEAAMIAHAVTHVVQYVASVS